MNDCIKMWLKRNKIYFETIAALLLSVMAFIVSVMQLKLSSSQTDLMKKQTNVANIEAELAKVQLDLQKKQTNNTNTQTVLMNSQTKIADTQAAIAKEQLYQQRKDAAIAKARDWAKLRVLLRPILFKYPELGNFTEIKGIENLTREQKIKWLEEMESNVSALGDNPILIGSRHNYERYLSMLNELSTARALIVSTDTSQAHEFFYSVTKRVGLHARAMYLDMGMMGHTAYPPTDARYQALTPGESIFEKGFPWESTIRRNVQPVLRP